MDTLHRFLPEELRNLSTCRLSYRGSQKTTDCYRPIEHANRLIPTTHDVRYEDARQLQLDREHGIEVVARTGARDARTVLGGTWSDIPNRIQSYSSGGARSVLDCLGDSPIRSSLTTPSTCGD